VTKLHQGDTGSGGGEPRRTEENRGEPRRTEENRGEPRRTEETSIFDTFLLLFC
jgi:hypothetical protein